MLTIMTKVPAKPFVKWAGGKTQLIEDVRACLPKDFPKHENVTYIEPFVGGGAILFWILQEYPNIKRAVINDINTQLICTYNVIKSDVVNLIKCLEKIQEEYISLDDDGRKSFFLKMRLKFNSKDKTELETAMLFIFLNRTCFNGLFRVNSKGEFNVPHGKYSNPKICDKETLLADSAILQNVKILCGDFEATGKYADKNSLYYFDPPYRPLSVTSAFTSYASNGFADSEQVRLKVFCDRIAKKRSLFIASNSDPQNVDEKDTFFDSLYKSFFIKRVSAARMINAKADRRGNISEVMISNVENI